VKLRRTIFSKPRELLVIFFVVTALVVLAVSGMFYRTRLDRYVPKTCDEEAIIGLIKKFHTAKNEYNLNTYLACLSENGKFMFAGSIMVSKKKLEKLLPPFWADRRSSALLTRPSSREELNGNFFPGELYDPVIVVGKDRAKTTITFMTPITRWTTKLFLDFQRQNSSWLISKLEWDMG
jgi:hypothetical protein